MSEIKKCTLKSVALAVTTQKQNTWKKVKKQWSEKMQPTIKTSEETTTWKNGNKKKWKDEEMEKGSLKNKTEAF